MAISIPPVPIGEPPNSFAWQQWYLSLNTVLTGTGTILWDLIDKTGSDLADLAVRDHASLQNMQGGTTGERYHLTLAQLSGLTSGAATSLHGHTMSNITDLPTLSHGTYTPTLTNVTNLDASTAYQCQYMRVGNTVTVSGIVDVDPIAAAATELGMSLPIASNFANNYELAGTGSFVNESARVMADTANNRASFTWTAADTTNRTMSFTFTYRII